MKKRIHLARYLQIMTKRPYYRKVKSLFGSALIGYWPLWEASGTVVYDISGNGRNGVTGGATGPTLGAAGVGDGKTAMSFPGANAFVNVTTAGLMTALSATTGTFMLFAKVSGAAVWTDATTRTLFRLYGDDTNYIHARRSTTNGQYQLQYTAGGTVKGVNLSGQTSVGWLHLGLTWDTVANQLIGYLQGVAQGSPTTGLGSWNAAAFTASLVGATTTGPVQVYSGSLAHILVLNRVATPTEVAKVQSFFA